jgi:hypothetical protein
VKVKGTEEKAAVPDNYLYKNKPFLFSRLNDIDKNPI